MKKLGVIYLCSVYILLNASTCKKGSLCLKTNQFFEIGVKSMPDYDSVKVGDTIWTVIDEPVNLLDKGTNSIVDFSGAVNLSANIGFQKTVFAPVLDFIPSASNFNFILIEGIEVANSNVSLFRNYQLLETGGKYKLKFGLVPKDTGIYRMVFERVANVYRKTNGCTNASFEINFKETNQHRYLIPGYGGNTVKGGDYYFKVK